MQIDKSKISSYLSGIHINISTDDKRKILKTWSLIPTYVNIDI